jgi:hypothetical protein
VLDFSPGAMALAAMAALSGLVTRREPAPVLQEPRPWRPTARLPEEPVAAPLTIRTPEPLEPLVLDISRAEIDSLDVGPALRTLEGWTRTPADARACRGRVRLAVFGYAGEGRPLHEIEEMRDYAEGLLLAFPGWFFIADPRGGALPLLAACTCRAERVAGTARLQRDDLRRFAAVHLESLARFAPRAELDSAECERIGRTALQSISAE